MRRANHVPLLTVLLAACAAPPARRAAPALPEPLARRVSVDDGGDPRIAAYFREAVEKTLKSPTARRLAQEVAQDGPDATLGFFAVPGSTIGVYQGEPYVTIRAAETFVYDSTAEIRLNNLLLKLPEQAPNSIAHELLGHAHDWGRARLDGSFPAYAYAAASELNAKLVGWTVDQELGDREDDRQIADFFSDTATYVSRHLFDAPSHSLGLTRAEMADARAAYKARLESLAALRKDYERTLESRRNELGWIDHFVEVHGVKRARFSPAARQVRNDIEADIPGQFAVFDAAKPMLEERAQLFSTDAHARILAEVARDPMVAAWDARTAELAAALRKVYVPKPPEKVRAAAKARPGEITLERLERMIEKEHRAGCPYAAR